VAFFCSTYREGKIFKREKTMTDKQKRLNSIQTPQGGSSVNIIRLPALQEKLGGVSKATVYRMVKEGLLPRQINIGSRCTGWVEAQVDEMLLSRVAEA
jgi:prophage regulatory protein